MIAEGRRAVRFWALWTLSVPALVVVLFVDGLGLAYAAYAFVNLSSLDELQIVVALTASALVAVEGARRVESRRRRGGPLHKDLAPAWMVAAAVVLQPALAIVVVLVLRIWWRVRAGRCVPYRWAFSTAVLFLSVGAAHLAQAAVIEALGADAVSRVVGMAAAAVAFFVTDALLCAAAITQIMPGSGRRDAIGGLDDLCVDGTAASLGCLVAAATLANPWAAVLAIPIALSAQRALLFGQLESEAQTDPKTGLARIDWWRRRTEDLLRSSRSQREPLAVLLIDVDHFKQINDRHGHLVGDEALRAIATILRGAIRTKDVIGRFGGEEFVIALPGTDLADATVTADRLRSAVAASPLAAMCAGVLDNRELVPANFRLTVSIGVAVAPDDGATLDGLLHSADRAMYAAKAAGRDRVRRAAECVPLS
ncbi:GGDEF domain-containing protein [Kribbella deserti]|uniref:Diguanylate cyclase n=1 Tax=Kribbella deserti TaxID=1926257 RepID=A0ABV6QI32_9ACTN